MDLDGQPPPAPPSPPPPSATAAPPPRQRVTNACEACRAAKVKCLPSPQGGICRRCLEFKRECVFRTGPRTRRPRQSQLNNDAPRPPPPAGPSKTFSIDFEMPASDDFLDNLEGLAERHERYIEELMPPLESDGSSMAMYDVDADDSSFGFSTPSSSSGHKSLSSLGLKPQFNLDSADRLLKSFREMLKSFPCIYLPPDATVPSLAKSRPFVLLAILSVSSGASALQGHSLYDEEFRKILGLKFVAGGERSLELLQGLLIYTAWYPFHLRPKNKQAFQYVRMAAEIVHDLELISPPRDSMSTDAPVTAEEIDGIRTYLACYYLVSAHVLPFLQYIRQTSLTNTRFVITWTKMSVLSLEYSSWTSTCCDILEKCSTLKGDHMLSWLVRLAHIVDEAAELTRGRASEQNEQHIRFMLMGLESQFRDWVNKMPVSMGDCHAITIAKFYTEIYLYAAPILKLPLPRNRTDPAPIPPSVERLEKCTPLLRRFFDFMVSLEASAFSNFTSIDWGRFIQCVILATRLSFPLPQMADWDHAKARAELQFGTYLARLTEMPDNDLTPSSKCVDILSASKVVLKVVKSKYERRLANTEALPGQLPKSIRGCPMLDGSLDQYFPVWDQDLSTGNWMAAGPPAPGTGQAVYHDLWKTMTMSWPTGPGEPWPPQNI